MTPESIAALVLQMKPPIGVFGESNIEIWRIQKAAELGIRIAFASILKNTTFNQKWK